MNTNAKKKWDCTILLAEDDPNEVFFLRRAFQEAHLNVRLWVACDGQEAIDFLKRQTAFAELTGDASPCLMLLDLHMPRKDGFDVLRWVRQQPELKGLVIVVMSSTQDAEAISRAYDLGANSYLVKPASFDEQVELVKLLHAYWLVWNRLAEMGKQLHEPPTQSEGHFHVPVQVL